MAKPDLSQYISSTYEIWVFNEDAPLFRYRHDLIYSVARNWSESWNKNIPSDVPPGSNFRAVRSITTYEVI